MHAMYRPSDTYGLWRSDTKGRIYPLWGFTTRIFADINRINKETQGLPLEWVGNELWLIREGYRDETDRDC